MPNYPNSDAADRLLMMMVAMMEQRLKAGTFILAQHTLIQLTFLIVTIIFIFDTRASVAQRLNDCTTQCTAAADRHFSHTSARTHTRTYFGCIYE